jgi:hypothetical protein
MESHLTRGFVNDKVLVLDAFYSKYLGCDIAAIAPGETKAIASKRRYHPEMGYGSIFVVWLLITKRRCVISTQDRLIRAVEQTIGKGPICDDYRDPQWQHSLLDSISRNLDPDLNMGSSSGPILYTTPELFRPQRLHPCRRVEEQDIPALQKSGLCDFFPEQSRAEGTAFVAYDMGQPVALAGTHEVPHMANEVADINVPGTLEPYRKQGFGKTVVSCTTEAVLAQGKLPVYSTSDSNTASIRTAQSVGYVEYGWRFLISL